MNNFLNRELLDRYLKIELDLSNYVTRVYFKNATGFDTSKFVKKVDLAILKSENDWAILN